MYTAVPAAATDAPRIHMTKATPTLPEERKMTLGVAKMPVPTTRLNMRNITLVVPAPITRSSEMLGHTGMGKSSPSCRLACGTLSNDSPCVAVPKCQQPSTIVAWPG